MTEMSNHGLSVNDDIIEKLDSDCDDEILQDSANPALSILVDDDDREFENVRRVNTSRNIGLTGSLLRSFNQHDQTENNEQVLVV